MPEEKLPHEGIEATETTLKKPEWLSDEDFQLLKDFEAIGYSVFIYPRKKKISISGIVKPVSQHIEEIKEYFKQHKEEAKLPHEGRVEPTANPTIPKELEPLAEIARGYNTPFWFSHFANAPENYELRQKQLGMEWGKPYITHEKVRKYGFKNTEDFWKVAQKERAIPPKYEPPMEIEKVLGVGSIDKTDKEWHKLIAEMREGERFKVIIKDSGKIIVDYEGWGKTQTELSIDIQNEITKFFGKIGEKATTPKGTFWRFANNKEEILYAKNNTIRNSVNHISGVSEKGLSVAEGPYYGDWGFKYGYRVSGDVVGYGYDGEPLLNVGTLKVKSKLLPSEKVKEQYLGAIRSWLKENNWTVEQYTAARNGLRFIKKP